MCTSIVSIIGILMALVLGAPGGVGSFSPAQTDCLVAPISDDAMLADHKSASVRTATLLSGMSPSSADAVSGANPPRGFPAHPIIVAQIVGLELEFAACYNAGEMRSAAALLSDNAQDDFLAQRDRSALSPAENRLQTPSPLPDQEQIPFIRMSNLRLLPDGRAGAIVSRSTRSSSGFEWPLSYNVYERVGCYWRIVDEIPVR